MAVFESNDNALPAERTTIRMLSDRLLFMRDEASRNDLREHLRSEIRRARELRHEAVASRPTGLQV